MSVAYLIVLDSDNPGFDPFVNGKSLAKEAGALDAICQQLGLRTFDEFVSMDVESILGEGQGQEGYDTEFTHRRFSADEGLAFVTALRDYIIGHSTTVKKPQGVLADLAEYIEVFTAAKRIGAKWHLEIDC
jgi:hypothetical protein